MNQKNLNDIFEHYIEKFEYINDYSGPLRATCPEFESHHSGE